MSNPLLIAKARGGGMAMRSQDYWQIFLETGAPELYLLYNNARKMESIHVLDHTGTGTESHGIQGL